MSEALSRRKFLRRSLAGGLVLLGGPALAACAGQAPAPSPTAAPKAAAPAPTAAAVPAVKPSGEPFKLGVATSLSGTYEAIGTDVKNGVEVRVRELNRTILGRPIELVIEDTEGKPDVALRKLEKLATKDGCKYVTGVITSAESMAMAGKLPELGVVYICGISKTAKLTGEACNKYIFRTVANDTQDAAVAGLYLAATPTLKDAKWSIVAADYEWGRDVAANFKKQVGAKLVSEDYPALGTKDFSTFINKLREAKPDAVYVANGGQDQVNFIKQATQFGLPQQMKFLWATSIPESSLQALGETALGLMFVSAYTWTLDTPENKKFVDEFRKVTNGVSPSMYAGDTYLGMQLLFAGIEKAGSTDVDKVIPALQETTVTSPLKMTIRKGDQQGMRDNYVTVVDKNAQSPYGVALKAIYAAPADKVMPPLDQTGCKNKP